MNLYPRALGQGAVGQKDFLAVSASFKVGQF